MKVSAKLVLFIANLTQDVELFRLHDTMLQRGLDTVLYKRDRFLLLSAARMVN